MRVLVFGDSVTQGFWDRPLGGWVNRLRAAYDNQAKVNAADSWTTLFNLGVSGDTTANIVQRLANETQARRLFEDPITIVINTGLNDAMTQLAEEGEEEFVATTELYEGGLKQLIGIARQYTERILFVGLTPVEEALTVPIDYGDDTRCCYRNERIAEFDKTLRRFCEDNTLPCVEVLAVFKQRLAQDEKLLEDGLHPNDAGHQLLAELVKPALDKLLA